MTEVASAYVSLIPTLKGAGDAIAKELDAPVDKAGKDAGRKLGKGLTSELKASVKGAAFGTILGAGLVGGLKAVTSGLSGLVADARESAKVTAITESVIKSTGGAAGISAGQIGDLATAISNKTGIDDEAIQSNENLLLTFTNVRNEVGKGNDVFSQAAGLSQDLATVLGTDAKGAALQLGKALNDPVAGISALSRSGVSFTAQQKEQIKALTKTGDVLGAQKIILSEVSKEFGGAAAAAANPADRLTTTLGNLREQAGTALLPAFNGLANLLVNDVVPAVSSLVGFITSNIDVIGPLALVIGSLVGVLFTVVKVTQAFTAAQAALDVVLAANPLVLLGLAIAAVVVGLVVLYNKSTTFRTLVGGAFSFVKGIATAVFDFFKGHWPLLLGILTGPFGLAVGYIIKYRDNIVGAIKAVPGLISKFAGGLFDGLVSGFKASVNLIIDGLNHLNFKVPSVNTHLPGVGTIGGFTVGISNIPHLASGGPIDRLSLVGENGPELFIPNQPGTILSAAQTRAAFDAPGGVSGGRGIEQTNHFIGVTPEQALAESNRQLLFALGGTR